MTRALGVLLLVLGAVLIETLAVCVVASFEKSPGTMLDSHFYVDPTMRASVPEKGLSDSQSNRPRTDDSDRRTPLYSALCRQAQISFC